VATLLEVRIDSLTDRQPMARKYDYTLKFAVKCNLNYTQKPKLCKCFPGLTFVYTHKRLIPAKETSQAIFLYTHCHGRTKLFQTSGGKKTTLALALRMTAKTLIKQTTFVV